MIRLRGRKRNRLEEELLGAEFDKVYIRGLKGWVKRLWRGNDGRCPSNN